MIRITTAKLREYKHSSGAIYVAYWDPGQILKIRDCLGDSGTVGAYGMYTSQEDVGVCRILGTCLAKLSSKLAKYTMCFASCEITWHTKEHWIL